jgi:hypothetical protein
MWVFAIFGGVARAESKVESRKLDSKSPGLLILIAFRTIKVNDQLSFEHVPLPGLNS